MNTIRLQGIADPQPARAVRDLKPGDIILWNYGYRSKVLTIYPTKTGKSYTVTTLPLDSTTPRIRTMRADTLLAVAEPDA